MDRYARQIVFPGIGEAGQQRLARSRVALIGCGALGTVLANVLARAGVGFLRIVDRDYVELSNLQRQVLFDEQDARDGAPKATAAVEKLRRINSEIEYEAVVEDFGPDNAERIVGDVDLVLDGTDNLETRYVLNDACVKLGKPWVYLAAVASYGVLMPIVPGETRLPALRLPRAARARLGRHLRHGRRRSARCRASSRTWPPPRRSSCWSAPTSGSIAA